MKTRPGFKLLFVPAFIFTLALSQLSSLPASAQAATLFVNDDVNDGLAAHWKFDESGSPTALDFLGANPMALQDTAAQSNASLPTLSVPDPASLALDGINDYAQVAAPTAALALSTSFSVTAWVRRTSTGTYDTIYDSGTQANKWWIFIADGSVGKNNRLGFGVRGVLEAYSTQSITDANWHHVAVIKNGDAGNNLSFYVDGAAAGTAAAGAVSVPSGSARIGALLDGALAAQYSGNIDDLRVYNRALSSAEVSRLAGGQGCVTDGATWATAFRELQCALAASTSGEEIWLAGGVYRPGTGREVSFHLVNGVNLLGGFNGTETTAGQRPPFSPTSVLTSLSGDVLGDDNPATFANYAENSRNVVIAGAGVSATLDGLAIRQGNNDVVSGSGAGLEVQAGALGLALNNVVVGENNASGNGAGIHSLAPLGLSGVTLSGNRSTGGNGGGLFSSAAVTANTLNALGNSAQFGGGVEISAPLDINNGLFDSNHAAVFSGGGIDASANLTVASVTFSNNQAGFSGGAIESSGAVLTISNSTFTNNHVNTFSGGAVDAGGAVTLVNSNFTANSAPQEGGAVLASGTSLTVQGGSFTSNQSLGSNCFPVCSSGSGGAITALGNLVVTGANLSNNTARLDGGAIAAKGAAAAIANSIFTMNRSGFPMNTGNPGLGRGGAIFSSGALTLDNPVVQSNAAQASGGGVHSAGLLTVISGTYHANSALSGGGLFAETGGNLSNAIILTNTATLLGGGVASGGGTLTLNANSFTGNDVSDPAGQGGGLHIAAGTVTINGGSFADNTAPKGGGLFNAGTLDTHGVSFSSNTASATGGGIYNAATMTDSASTFDQNHAVDGGGAAFAAGIATSGHGAFSGTVFSNNTATRGGGLNSINDVALNGVSFTTNHATTASGDGGGLFTSGGVAALDGVTFTANDAGRFGGGARVNAAQIQRSTFANNTAASEGGGILLTNASQISATVFHTNSSNLSGAVSMQGTPDRSQILEVYNSLFYDNRVVSSAGAADMRLFDLTITLGNNTYARPGAAGQRSVAFFRSNLAAKNNIWSGYLTSLNLGQTAAGITILEDYNLFFNAPLDASVTPGAHGLTADPRFVDPLANNFRLQGNSPAIDSGDDTILPLAVTTDLTGLPRFADAPGVPNTGVGAPPVDRGAYEFGSGKLFLPVIMK